MLSPYRYHCRAIHLLVVVVAVTGCAERTVIPLSADAQDSGGQNQDYFDYAVDNLNHLSKFGPTQILSQIIDRLNQWSRIEQPQTNWQLDPLLATLPEIFQTGPLISSLEDATYTNYDGAYLRECALVNGVANYASLNSSDDLEAAQDLFEWVVAHIALDPQPAANANPSAQLPWQTLLLGHGTAVDRAWLFALLARQIDLDVVLLYLPQAAGPDESPTLTLWTVGVLHNGELYLFDPTYGLPLPGPDQSIATLTDVQQNAALLRAWDTAEKPYWVTDAMVEQVVPFVEASPQSLSKRMKSVQMALGGQNRMRLVNNPSQLADVIDALDQMPRPRIWPWPYVAGRILADPANQDRSRIASELGQYSKFVIGEVNPLWAGRLQQLAGRYTTQIEGVPRRSHDAPIGEKGAKPLLLASRTMAQKLPKKGIPAEDKKQIDFLFKRADVIRRDATRHLATIALDEGNYPLAEYYLDQTDKQQTAPTWPKDSVKRSTMMTRGRVAEAAGDLSKAVQQYREVSGPERDEAAQRVKRIQSKLSSEKS